MSDVVERLRDYRTEDETRHTIEHEICFEAADEIERLRDQVASLTAAAQFVKSHLDADTFRGDVPDEAHAMIAAAIREGG